MQPAGGADAILETLRKLIDGDTSVSLDSVSDLAFAAGGAELVYSATPATWLNGPADMINDPNAAKAA